MFIPIGLGKCKCKCKCMGMGEGLKFYKALMPWGGAVVSEPWLGWVWLVVGLFFCFLVSDSS